MKIIEFLDQHDIRWFPINLEIRVVQNKDWIKKKKFLKPYADGTMPNYNEFSDAHIVLKRQNYVNMYDNIWIDTRIISEIDVDGDFDPEINTPYFKSVSKQRPHYFVKGFQGIMKKRVDTKWKDVELLCGQGSYASKDLEIFNSELDIKDYCGKTYEVLSNRTFDEDEDEVAYASGDISGDVNSCLNQLFGTSGNWKSNVYEHTNCVCMIPSTKQCLVNPDKTHSCVQSFVTLGKTTITIRCHSCGDKKVNPKDDKKIWKQIREYYDIDTQKSADKVGYETIQEYLDSYCVENDIMKKDGFMMKRSSDCCIEYEPISKYADFLDDLFRDADISLKRIYKKPTSKKHLIEYLTNIHTDITILKRDSNIISFKNGFLKIREFEFYEYSGEIYKFIAKKYIPMTFNPDWLNMRWDEITVPVFDKIIKDQPQLSCDSDVMLVFYGLLGSLHFPVGYDTIKVCPYLVGTSGTGKSTIVNIILNTFAPEIVGAINYKEKIFGKSAFLSKDVIIDQDTPATMIREFGKTDFQKAVSGETIAIPIKNQKTEDQHKVTQRMLFCSQYTQDVQDTGEVIRRIAYFGFEPVENTRSNLEEDVIKNELHLVLIKILLARNELIKKFNNKPFHEWNIPYFDSRKEDVLLENNPIYKFISDNNCLRVRKGSKIAFETFTQYYADYYKTQGQRLKKPKTTDVMFSKLGLHITKHIVCKDCMQKFSIIIKCCDKHNKNNKSTKYFINDLEIFETPEETTYKFSDQIL